MQQRGESWHGESLPALPLQAAACLLGGWLGQGRALGREGFLPPELSGLSLCSP